MVSFFLVSVNVIVENREVHDFGEVVCACEICTGEGPSLVDREEQTTEIDTRSKLTSPEACGGTLGAIISIFLAGITNALIASSTSTSEASPEFMGKMALAGLETLKQRTAARVGHRTVMDALIPFAEVLAQSGDIKKAAEATRKGGESTVELVAKLGRATYVGEREDGGALPPDPGAMAFVVVAEGLAKVLG